MRRNVTVAMSALTAAVVGLSVRASGLGGPATPAVAAAGVVHSGPTIVARPALPAHSRRPSTHPDRRRSGPPASAPARKAPAPVPTTTTVNGASVGTQYGPVQVQLTLRSGRVTRAQAIDFPHDVSQSQQINNQAIPILDGEALQAQSARIDTVSGATYTSAGYQQSLQSALDAAHRAGVR